MSIEIKIEGLQKLQEILSKIPERLFPPVKAEVQKAVAGLHSEMQDRVSNGVLKRRTGELARSFITVVTGSKLSELFGVVATKSKYAPIHEFGGTIFPKKAKNLTIPLDANKTPAGVMRKSATQLMNEGKSFFKTTKKGKLILFTKQGNKIQPMFLLVKSSTIPARLGFTEAAQKWFDSLLNGLQGLIERTS